MKKTILFLRVLAAAALPCLQACRTMQAPIDYSRLDSDPAVRRQMMERRAYQGVWGVSREFNIHFVRFSADGSGILNGFMLTLPFKWTADREGCITCRFVEDIAMIYGIGPESMTCRYNPVSNEMMMEDYREACRGSYKPQRLPYCDVGESLEKLDERVAQIKRDPELRFEYEAERAKWAKRVASGEVAERRREMETRRREQIAEMAKRCLEELKKADEKGKSIFESREDAERGFYFVEDDKVKSAVVEYARRSFPDFHPEWGKAGWIRYIWPW